MIQPRIAENPKVLVLFDIPQDKSWSLYNKVSKDGVMALLKGFVQAGIDLNDVSMQCLTDDPDGKAAGYKEKQDHIQELVGTLAPNVIVLANSKAHEKFTGVKGASKFYNRIWVNDNSDQKLLTIPPYSATVYNPILHSVIASSIQLLKKEMEFPEVRGVEKAEKDYVLVDTIEKYRKWHDLYKTVTRYALDIETTSLQFNRGEVLTIQFSEGANKGWCIPTTRYFGEWTEAEWTEIISGIKEVIEDDSKEVILANAYFDLKYLHYNYGIKLRKHNVTDVLIQSFLIDENRESHSLKYCAATLLPDAGDYERPLQEFIDAYCKGHKMKKMAYTYDLTPLPLLFRYSCMDVDYSYQLADYFKPLLEKEEQTDVYKDVIRYSWALARIELSGWKVDLAEANRYKAELEERIPALTQELLGLPEIAKAEALLSAIALRKENEKRKVKITELKTPLKFMTSSVAHKRVLFRDVLKLREIKKTKKGEYATDKECFTAWLEKRPDLTVLTTIKKIEELTKMLNTYVMAIITKSVNGRISCNYRITGAATGRISSSNPNLQNVSQHSDEADKLKKCFTSEEGHLLVVCDLSNAELRVTAAISKDPVMNLSFAQGLDPHSSTAKSVFNLDCDVSEIKEKYKEYRQRAKTLNFAALYGSSAINIAKSLGISEQEAQELLDSYFDKHSGIRDFFNNNIEFARKYGFVIYPNGRRRRVPHINSTDRVLRAKAERQVNNSIIQGPSSDIALMALANIWEEIDAKGLPYKVVNVIHDSLELEVPEELVDDAVEMLVRNMSIWGKNMTADFPMKADAEVGKTWADLKEYEDHVPEALLEDLEEEDEDE